MNRKLLDLALGALLTIALAIASFSLKWTFDANAEMRVLRADLERVRLDRERDERQDRQLKMFWSYTQWLHWNVDVLRHKAGLEPAEKPKLE